MAIPTVALSDVPNSPAGGPRLSEEAFNSTNRAIAGAGRALQGSAQDLSYTSDLLRRYEVQKGQQVAKGQLAGEEVVRLQTAAQISDYMTKNQGTPETFDQFTQDTWKSYEEGRTKRIKEQKWSPEVAKADQLYYNEYKAKANIQFKVQTDKALINQSNTRLLASAEQNLRAGDYEGYKKQVGEMNLTPEKKEQMLRTGLQEGSYNIANNQLDAISELPPAQRTQAYNAFKANINARDEKTGRFTQYEYEDGGMTLGGRMQLDSVANARIKAAQNEMDGASRKFIGQFKTGRSTTQDLASLVKTGQMDEATALAIEPEMQMILAEKQEKLDAKAQALAVRQDTRADQVRAAALTPDRIGTVAARDVEQEVALGRVSADEGRRITAELDVAARAEQASTTSQFSQINKAISSEYTKKLMGFKTNIANDPDAQTYNDIRNSIIGAKLTKQSRLQLMDNLMQLKLADISDLEEGNPDPSAWMDRNISPSERAVRRDMINQYKQLAPALGDVRTGDLLFAQEAKIRTFFDSAPNGGERSPAEVQKFLKEELMPEAQKAAGIDALSGAFDF